MRLSLFALLATALILSACKKNAQPEQGGAGGTPVNTAPAGPAINVPYTLDSTKLITTLSGLRYQIIEEGTGVVPRPGEMIIAHYHGTLPDGTKFDSSVERGQPFNFPLGQQRVISGWDEAFALFKVGTKAILILPPNLAYGEAGAPPTIPPGATLRFDVELLGTAPAPAGGQMQMN